jgi:hypothetical protein
MIIFIFRVVDSPKNPFTATVSATDEPSKACEEFNEDQGEFFGQLKEDDFVP